MYWKDIWVFKESTEYEYKFAGKYGAKGEKRETRKKATPEMIKKQNQQNREKNVRRLIKANFKPYDIWAALKYPKGTRKPLGEVKKDLKGFLDAMRRQYKRIGEKFRFIYRLEIGKQGGIHIHILVNRIREKVYTDVLIQKLWRHGRVNFQSIHETGGYKELAEYIVKQPDEETERQLSLFGTEERKEFIKYSSSRNLIRPKPERREYRRWTVKRLIEEGPKPSPGYYIDKESVRSGINRYTGLSYLHYTEYRINGPWDGVNTECGRKTDNEKNRCVHRDKHPWTTQEGWGRGVSG